MLNANNRQEYVIKGLIGFAIVFVLVALYGLWLLLVGGPASVVVSRPIFSNPFPHSSHIHNNAIRLFNGRNFIEVNLKDGTTKSLLDSDDLFPSYEVLGWSEDTSQAIVRSLFHRPDDILAEEVAALGLERFDEILWHLDLESGKHTALPVGFASAAFSSNSDLLYLLESVSIDEASHAESPTIAGYSLRQNKVLWATNFDALPIEVNTVNNRVIITAFDQITESIVLYLLKGSAITKMDSPEFIDVFVGENGYTAYQSDELNKETSEYGEGSLVVYDINFEEILRRSDVGAFPGFAEIENTVYLSYEEDDDIVIETFNRDTLKLEKYVVTTEEGASRAQTVSNFQSASSDDLLFASAARSIRYVGEDTNFSITKDLAEIDYQAVAGALSDLGFLRASSGQSSIQVTLFEPLTKDRASQINEKVREIGIDPNLVQITFEAEY